jgi:hypothetical protein
MLVRIEEAARIRILPFARGCLLETNKENTMTIRIAIIAAFASTLVLTATIAYAETPTETVVVTGSRIPQQGLARMGGGGGHGQTKKVMGTKSNNSERMGGGGGHSGNGNLQHYWTPALR